MLNIFSPAGNTLCSGISSRRAIIDHALDLNADDTIITPANRPVPLLPSGEVPLELL